MKSGQGHGQGDFAQDATVRYTSLSPPARNRPGLIAAPSSAPERDRFAVADPPRRRRSAAAEPGPEFPRRHPAVLAM
jgi:hypothetical protein